MTIQIPNIPSSGGGGTTVELLYNPPIIGSNFSSGSAYESGNIDGLTYIRLKHRVLYDFSGGRDVTPATDTETSVGWSWLSGTALDLCDENDTTTDACRWGHGNTDTTWNNSTKDSPFRYKEYSVELSGYTPKVWVTRIRMTGSNINNEMFQLLIQSKNTTTDYYRLGIRHDGATYLIGDLGNGGSGSDTSITDAEAETNGIWLKIILSGRSLTAEYSLANQADPPAEWVSLYAQEDLVSIDETVVRVGHTMLSGDTSATLVGDILYYDDFYAQNSLAFSSVDPCFAATEPDDSNPLCSVITDFDLGDDDAVIDDVFLRKILADVSNVPQFANADITFSSIQSGSTGAGAGSASFPISLTTSGTGRYWNLFMYIDASTDYFGAFGPLPFVVKAGV